MLIHEVQLFIARDVRVERFVQAQGDVRIFRCVVARGFHGDLIEADLLRALARDFFVADGLVVEMAVGERIHAVRLVRFQHIGLEQGVVGNAA